MTLRQSDSRVESSVFNVGVSLHYCNRSIFPSAYHINIRRLMLIYCGIQAIRIYAAVNQLNVFQVWFELVNFPMPTESNNVPFNLCSK